MQEPKNNKPEFTLEQLKQLLPLQNNSIANKKAKHKIKWQKILMQISNIIQRILYYLDRFVNFTTKKVDLDRNDVAQHARSPILFGAYVIIFFVVIGGMWVSMAPLNSAAVALGIVIENTNRKLIQHQEGGIIKNIFVTQGDKVKEGDKLIELEDTRAKAHYESALSSYRHALAAESRLIAERENSEHIEFPEFLTNDRNIAEVDKIILIQENLFRSKKELDRSKKESLKQHITQLHKKIEGLNAQQLSQKKNLEVMSSYLESLNSLYTKGLTSKSTLLEQEAKVAQVNSEIAMGISNVASAYLEITKTEIEIINLQNTSIEKMLIELREIQKEVAQSKEQLRNYSDALDRTIIRSPINGIINVLRCHTLGGVINQGQQVLEISPTNDSLIIEAKIPPKNIDSVHEGLVAKIRFSAFKSRTTPLFTGKVIKISPSTVVEDKDRQQGFLDGFYIARIEIDMEEFNKIAKAKNLKLHSGMQAEVQIITGTRTLLRYLLDPIIDTMFKAFKEK